MPIGAVLGIGSSLIGAASTRSASRSGERAAQNELALQERVYEENVGRFQPFYDDGRDYAAVRNYLDGIGGLPTFGARSLEIEEVAGAPTPYWSSGRARDDGLSPSYRPGATTYRVGGQTFDTREAAQRYADQNSTGGTEYQGFQATPGYQFAVEQGTSAIEGSAAARGGLYSGRTMQDLNDYGQGMANQEFNNYYNRIAGGAAQGQAAAGQQAQAGQNYATGASTAYGNIGNAQAAGAIGVGNALQGGLSNTLGLMNYQNSLNGGSQNATIFDAPWGSGGFW